MATDEIHRLKNHHVAQSLTECLAGVGSSVREIEQIAVCGNDVSRATRYRKFDQFRILGISREIKPFFNAF